MNGGDSLLLALAVRCSQSSLYQVLDRRGEEGNEETMEGIATVIIILSTIIIIAMRYR